MNAPLSATSGLDAETDAMMSEWKAGMKAAEAEYQTRKSEFQPPEKPSTAMAPRAASLSAEDQAELKMMETMQTSSPIEQVSEKVLDYLEVGKAGIPEGGVRWKEVGHHLLEEAVDEAAEKLAHVARHHAAPPPLPKKILQWHYALHDETKGPVTEEELLALVERGEIKTSTLVWNKTMSEWARLADTPLAEKIRHAPPPLPTTKKSAKSKDKPAASKCPTCGHATDPADRFCPDCGAPLR